MNNNLGRLGGQLGVLLCLIGFVAVFLGWNGAAGKNIATAQFPYLISGGITGLAIVIIGAALLIVQNAREDRARVEAVLERLVTALEAGGGSARPATGGVGAGGGTLVLAGSTSYHRLDCTLPAAREEAHVVPIEEAFTRQMEACRVCKPPALAQQAY